MEDLMFELDLVLIQCIYTAGLWDLQDYEIASKLYVSVPPELTYDFVVEEQPLGKLLFRQFVRDEMHASPPRTAGAAISYSVTCPPDVPGGAGGGEALVDCKQLIEFLDACVSPNTPITYQQQHFQPSFTQAHTCFCVSFHRINRGFIRFHSEYIPLRKRISEDSL